ncbi:MAG TPA: hypothetical protein DEP84_19790, partial [Chloroflexi bacterium]|nr:hypothetical protein [Chloroflexota bacterium]
SIKLWEGLPAALGFDFEYVQGGNIRMAATEERMAALRKEGEEELADGLVVEIWDRDDLRRRAPYLGDVFIGAKYCPTDGNANPILTSRAFGWACQQAGVTLLTHTEVVDIGIQAGRVTHVTGRSKEGEVVVEAPRVIHAGGPWTPHLSASLGIHVPIEPRRSIIGVTQRLAPFFTEFVSTHDLNVYARQAQEGHVHVGRVGSPDRTFDQTAPAEVLAELARGAAPMIPALRGVNFLRMWAGTLAMTPDKIPIIDPATGVEGYILAAGFSGHGFCLGPIVGKLISELIVDGEPSLPLHDFRLSRFAGPPAA